MLKASYLPTYFGLPLLDVITYVQIPTYCENYVESYLPTYFGLLLVHVITYIQIPTY